VERAVSGAMLRQIGLPAPRYALATSFEEAKQVADSIGYPVMVRPSFVLGGRAMAIVYDERRPHEDKRTAVDASPEKPVLIDKFLERAAEFDVDALADDETCVV